MKKILVILSLVLSPFAMGLYAQCDSVKDITVNGGGDPVLSNDRDNLLKERFLPNLLDVMQSNSNVMGHFQGFYSNDVFYDSNLLSQFMAEPLVAEFRNCIETFELEVYNGILRLKHVEDAEALYDTLIYYSDRWDSLLDANPQLYKCYIVSETFPNYPMLYAFESIMSFSSLRAKIENEMLELEAGDGISDDNNPDEHYIVSDFMRTLLTPDCEIIVDSVIFLTGKYMDLVIYDLNLENLEEVKRLWREHGEINGTLQAFKRSLAYGTPPQKAGDTCRCEYLFIHEIFEEKEGCPPTFTFEAQPYEGGGVFHTGNQTFPKKDCDIFSIFWEFGDGGTSNSSTPKHKYSKAGDYTVKVTMRYNNNLLCDTTKKITVKDCMVSIANPVKDESYDSDSTGARYLFAANAINCNGAAPTQYIWDFGDGGTDTTTTDTTSHIYILDSKRTISVSVSFSDNCSASNSLDVDIKGTGNECRKKGDKDTKPFWYDDDGKECAANKGTYKLNHFFTTRQFWRLWHRVVVKNTFYKKNKKGKWKEEKAYTLYANFSGKLSNGMRDEDECNLEDKNGKGKSKTNKKSMTYDWGYGTLGGFKVAKESIASEFKVQVKKKTVKNEKEKVIKLYKK